MELLTDILTFITECISIKPKRQDCEFRHYLIIKCSFQRLRLSRHENTINNSDYD